MSKSVETVAGYKVHPAALVFPPMADDEFAELVADIKAHGQLDPCVEHEGVLLDGRNRALACEALGIKPIVRPWDRTGGTPLDYIVGKNKRRNLTQSQRAAIAAELIPMFAEEAAQRKSAAGGENLKRGPDSPVSATRRAPGNDAPPHKAADDAAKATGATTRSVERAARVMKASPKKHAEVKAGTKSATVAEREVRAKAPKEKAPEVSSAVALNQERWAAIQKPINALFKALNQGLILTNDGAMCDEKDLRKMITDGRGVTKMPEVFAATLDTVRRAVVTLAPIVRESYQRVNKK